MARISHSTNSVLRAARTVILRDGLRATTVAAIARESGAPVGSIYHRFDSLDQILALIWLEAVRGSHAPYATGAGRSALELAVAHYDYCVSNREDVLLLELLRAHDIAGLNVDTQLQTDIADLNAETRSFMAKLASRTFARVDRSLLDLLALAVIDIPYGFVRPYLHADQAPPRERRELLPGAVRSVLEHAERSREE